MAEAAVRFVIEKLLRPIGIDISPKTFNEAASSNEEVLNEIRQAVYTLIANFLFANKQDARNWVRKCNSHQATDILRLWGFDPFLFDLDGSTQHLLIALLWLVWRSDLFKTLYDPLLPQDDAYLPPYGVLCADENDFPPEPIRSPPEDPTDLSLRIQRLTGRISYQLQTLSDLEVTRETLHWQIRAIDPDSSLYALSLKSKPTLLAAHTAALRQAVQNSEKLKEIARVEQTFWKWAYDVVDNLQIDPSRFDETRSLPVDWYPPFTQAPFSRHNKGVDELEKVMTELKRKLAQATEKVGTGRVNERNCGLNLRQVDLITHEIEDLMEKLERIEEVKLEEQRDSTVKLIPDLPFKDFSDTKLQRLITRSQEKSEDIAARSCPVIARFVADLCGELGYVPHGWKCTAQAMSHEEEDEDEKPPPPKRKSSLPFRPAPVAAPIRPKVPAKAKPQPVQQVKAKPAPAPQTRSQKGPVKNRKV
jgi:hypothetical protein